MAGGFVYRGEAIPELRGRYVFGDIPTGRVFHVPVDELRQGRQAEVRELTLLDDGRDATVLDLVDGDDRADLRLGRDEDGELYLISKQDDSVRALRRPGTTSPEADGPPVMGADIGIGYREDSLAFASASTDLAPLG